MRPEAQAMPCTYCAAGKRKGPGMLPAVERYLSDRISGLHAAGPMLILSGEYGLLAPEDPIPWYNHLLQPEEVEGAVPRVADQLRERAVRAIEFHTADPAHTPEIGPYVALIRGACARVGIPCRLVILPGRPA